MSNAAGDPTITFCLKGRGARVTANIDLASVDGRNRGRLALLTTTFTLIAQVIARKSFTNSTVLTSTCRECTSGAVMLDQVSLKNLQPPDMPKRRIARRLGPTRIASTAPLTRSEFLPDVQSVAQGLVVGATGWKEQHEANQTDYFNEFVQRPNFVAIYPPTMTSAQYVDSLNANAGGPLSTSERDQLVNELSSGTKTRAQVLRAVAENEEFTRAHFNRAFVLMQYFGYLRRNPNDIPDNNFDGYNFWLTKLDQFNGNFVQAEMVKAFITSIEYQQRFGP